MLFMLFDDFCAVLLFDPGLGLLMLLSGLSLVFLDLCHALLVTILAALTCADWILSVLVFVVVPHRGAAYSTVLLIRLEPTCPRASCDKKGFIVLRRAALVLMACIMLVFPDTRCLSNFMSSARVTPRTFIVDWWVIKFPFRCKLRLVLSLGGIKIIN